MQGEACGRRLEKKALRIKLFFTLFGNQPSQGRARFCIETNFQLPPKLPPAACHHEPRLSSPTSAHGRMPVKKSMPDRSETEKYQGADFVGSEIKEAKKLIGASHEAEDRRTLIWYTIPGHSIRPQIGAPRALS
jgi:hypothetical protein